VNKLTWKKD